MAPDTKTESLEAGLRGDDPDTGCRVTVVDTGDKVKLNVSHQYNSRVNRVALYTSPLLPLCLFAQADTDMWCECVTQSRSHAPWLAQSQNGARDASESRWGRLTSICSWQFCWTETQSETALDNSVPRSDLNWSRCYIHLLIWSHLRLRWLRQLDAENRGSTRCQLWHMAFKTRRFQLTFFC